MKVTFSSSTTAAAHSGRAEERRYDRVVHELRLELPPQTTCSGSTQQRAGEDRAQLGQPFEPAVVAQVDTGAVRVRRRQIEQPVGQVELRAGRLAAGQVERQAREPSAA